MTVDLTGELDAAHRLARARSAPLGLTSMASGPKALDSLAALVTEVGRPGEIVVLEDATPIMRGAQLLKPLVAESLAQIGVVHRVTLGPPDGKVHADQPTIAEAAAAVASAGCVVTVGAGTITDIGKEAARAHGVPLVVIQTAASVNGFADHLAVVLREGVKRTTASVWPTALVIDVQVLASAPPVLTASGFGDLMSMFTAPADWRLASAIGHDDGFDPAVVELYRPRGPWLLASAAALRRGEEPAIELLAALLTASGLAMGICGVTAPSSGLEHMISHLLDMSADMDSRPVGWHGAQVGVASVIAACLWEAALASLDPVDLLRPGPAPELMHRTVEAAFAPLDPSGRTGAECWSDYGRKLNRWAATEGDRARLVSSWPRIRAELGALVGDPAEIVAGLRAVGAPTRFGELDPPIDPDRARWTVGAAHLMRDRFTVADLMSFAGHWNADDVDAVLARAAALGGGL